MTSAPANQMPSSNPVWSAHVETKRTSSLLSLAGSRPEKRDLDAGEACRPPNLPWRPVTVVTPSLGCLSVFYSDPLAALPVREVTRPGDNKSDPNLETGTFGLFSTCEKSMRSSVLKHGLHYVFFITTHHPGEGRVVAGYYEMGWWCSAGPEGDRDFSLAAKRTHFVENPISVADVTGAAGETCRSRFRQYRLLTSPATESLVAILDAQPDISSSYVDEIHRLERFNLTRTGYRYVGWNRTASFSWSEALPYLGAADAAIGLVSRNVSSTGRWLCTTCRSVTANKSLLRACPICNSIGTLIPEGETA